MLKILNLQLFAEGATPAGAPMGEGMANATVANDVKAEEKGEKGARPSLDELLKDEGYKAEYEAKVKGTLDKRFKQANATEAKMKEMRPIIELMGSRYGVEAGEGGEYDLTAISKAIMDDESFFEEEALEKGITVSQLKEMKKLESENRAFKRKEAEEAEAQEKRQFYEKIARQEEEVKRYYPAFNLEGEMEREDFKSLFRAGVPLKTAYEVVHKDELLGGAMARAANATLIKAANAVKTGTLRPAENGNTPTGAPDFSFNPRKLTPEEREDIRKRVARGEKISF